MACETLPDEMHEKEEVEVNVLEYQHNFSTSFWIRTILLGIILIPLRLFLILAITLSQWLFATYPGIGCVFGLDFHVVEWMVISLRLSLDSAGMMVSVEGVKSDDAPIIVVGPHTTFWDGLLLVNVKPPPVVAMADYQRRIPVLGELLNHK